MIWSDAYRREMNDDQSGSDRHTKGSKASYDSVDPYSNINALKGELAVPVSINTPNKIRIAITKGRNRGRF